MDQHQARQQSLASSLGATWAIGIVLAVAGCASSTLVDPDTTPTALRNAQQPDRLTAFEPKPDGRQDAIDYVGVDKVLNTIVFPSGPSLRRWAPLPRPSIGTHIVHGHTSPFRLEGNKIIFSRMTRAQKEAVFSNVEDLISFGNELNISRLPRSAQLAYWFNLHNMLVISEVLKRYPVTEPRRIKIGPEKIPLHDAPLVTIQNISLSLRDIRVGIVYRYWSDPRVIYGFFRGDIASPSIRTHAFMPETIWADLEKTARKFVNGLRGVRPGRWDPAVRVSPVYEEARAVLFPEWPHDLRRHLKQWAAEEVSELLKNEPTIAVAPYEGRIADVAGGEPRSSGLMVLTQAAASDGPDTRPPASFSRMMREFTKKYILVFRMYRVGRVTIEDLSDDLQTKRDSDQDTSKNER